MKKIAAKIALTIVVITFIVIFGWKIPIILKIETMKLPPGCETVYPTKIHVSDVYWLHIKGEKVIKCDQGYEAVKEYIESHNSEFKRLNITIDPYGGVSDISIYDSEFDEYFKEQPDQENYIVIDYFLTK